jgi:hypothetical protein
LWRTSSSQRTFATGTLFRQGKKYACGRERSCISKVINLGLCLSDDSRFNLQNARAPDTKESVQSVISDGAQPADVIFAINSAMEEVGRRFSKNEIYLPEMMIAARAIKFGMETLEPLIVGQVASTRGKILLGTIKGRLA